MNNWLNIPDEEFDGIFRDAADNHEVEFEPASWDKMTQKLDLVRSHSVESQKSNPWIIRGLLPLSLLLFVLIGIVMYNNSSDSNQKIATKIQTKDNGSGQLQQKRVFTDKVNTYNKSSESETETLVNKSENPLFESNVDGAKSPNVVEVEKSKIDNSDTPIVEKTVTKTVGKNLIENQKRKDATSSTGMVRNRDISEANLTKNSKVFKIQGAEINASKAKSENQKIYPLQNEKRTNSKEKTVVFDDGFEVKSVDNQLVVISPALVENIENNNFKNQFSQLTSIKNKAFNLNPAFIQPSIKQPLSTILENKMSITPSASQFKKGLAVRLAYSPDLSVIFGDKIEKIGRNIGVFAEYRINNRWSVNTGVIRSMKYYDAYPEDYSWIWKMPETPLLEINATCDMLDIPLNIRYDITQNSTSRIFASAGFTSYVMLKEKYKYNYANNYDPSIKWKEWEGSTGAYPFSISNLSVGYERQIFRKVSLQVEPFVKIPLGQVGFGKVRLVTTGVFFSAKYPLTFKK
jgi:hypothetical protein